VSQRSQLVNNSQMFLLGTKFLASVIADHLIRYVGLFVISGRWWTRNKTVFSNQINSWENWSSYTVSENSHLGYYAISLGKWPPSSRVKGSKILWLLKVKTPLCFETSETIYPSTRRHFLEVNASNNSAYNNNNNNKMKHVEDVRALDVYFVLWQEIAIKYDSLRFLRVL
jgi:hypothetical protein